MGASSVSSHHGCATSYQISLIRFSIWISGRTRQMCYYRSFFGSGLAIRPELAIQERTIHGGIAALVPRARMTDARWLMAVVL